MKALIHFHGERAPIIFDTCTNLVLFDRGKLLASMKFTVKFPESRVFVDNKITYLYNNYHTVGTTKYTDLPYAIEPMSLKSPRKLSTASFVQWCSDRWDVKFNSKDFLIERLDQVRGKNVVFLYATLLASHCGLKREVFLANMVFHRLSNRLSYILCKEH